MQYITVAYELFADGELVEQATAEHPFQFISGLGAALDAFEKQVEPLSQGQPFDFTLSVDDAYGPYMDEHVLKLDREIFCTPDGRFDKENIYAGNVIPLMNADGQRFQGIVVSVADDKVTVDLNHPLAGKELRFRGTVTQNRPATKDEVTAMVKMLSGEGGCSCGCDDCGGHCHDEADESEHCCHHHEGHDEQGCHCHCHEQ